MLNKYTARVAKGEAVSRISYLPTKRRCSRTTHIKLHFKTAHTGNMYLAHGLRTRT